MTVLKLQGKTKNMHFFSYKYTHIYIYIYKYRKTSNLDDWRCDKLNMSGSGLALLIFSESGDTVTE